MYGWSAPLIFNSSRGYPASEPNGTGFETRCVLRGKQAKVVYAKVTYTAAIPGKLDNVIPTIGSNVG